MNPKSIPSSRSEIAREIEALGGTIVMHPSGRQLVHQPPGSRNSLETYGRIRRLSMAYYDAPAECVWGVAVLKNGSWEIVTDSLSKADAERCASIVTACDCAALAVRRFQ